MNAQSIIRKNLIEMSSPKFCENTYIGPSETSFTGKDCSKFWNVLGDSHALFQKDRLQKKKERRRCGPICSEDNSTKRKTDLMMFDKIVFDSVWTKY